MIPNLTAMCWCASIRSFYLMRMPVHGEDEVYLVGMVMCSVAVLDA